MTLAVATFGFTVKTYSNSSMDAKSAYYFGTIYDLGDVVHCTSVFYAPVYNDAVKNSTIEYDFKESFYSKYPN